MRLDDAITLIESCTTQQELNFRLQAIVESMGFAAYSFVDTGAPHRSEPYWTSTTSDSWQSTYVDHRFIEVDEMIHQARRTNRPFSWSQVKLPQRRGRRKPGALKVMEASADHGFRDGLVIPYHFVDDRGSVCSSLCTLFWTEPPHDMTRATSRLAPLIHLILVYWMQKSLDLRDETPDDPNVIRLYNRAAGEHSGPSLTDREREVLGWAARGKTAAETAEIMTVSTETVNTHLKRAIDRLAAGNKTHAVAKAVRLGLVTI